MELAKLDKNFAVQNEIDRTGLCFYDVEQAPFRVYGVKMMDGCYRRLPESVARSVSEGVLGAPIRNALRVIPRY